MKNSFVELYAVVLLSPPNNFLIKGLLKKMQLHCKRGPEPTNDILRKLFYADVEGSFFNNNDNHSQIRSYSSANCLIHYSHLMR